MTREPHTRNHKPQTGDLFQAGATFRVDFADTDPQARVYYGNYFRYFDRARFAYWDAIGCDAAAGRRRFTPSGRGVMAFRPWVRARGEGEA